MSAPRKWMSAAVVVLISAVAAPPAVGSHAAEVKRLEKRVQLQQKAIRARNADLADARAAIKATWAAIGEASPQYRTEPLASAVAGVQAQLSAAQAAVADSIVAQLAVMPSTATKDVIPALCQRVRVLATVWRCSSFGGSFVSYEFDTLG